MSIILHLSSPSFGLQDKIGKRLNTMEGREEKKAEGGEQKGVALSGYGCGC